jgi:hypothetical protein
MENGDVRVLSNLQPRISLQAFQVFGELVRDLIDPAKDSLIVEEDSIKQPNIPGLSNKSIESLAM